jgi:hypothetical protein
MPEYPNGYYDMLGVASADDQRRVNNNAYYPIKKSFLIDFKE